jgi:hypothetical protein
MATPLQSARSASSPLGIALAFLGMFVVGSLAVQLLATLPRNTSRTTTAVPATEGPAPVVAHPATLWSALGDR